MTKASFVLISFESVDGYPPVQNQARLLSEAGHRVYLITQPLNRSRDSLDFTAPGVVTYLQRWRALPGGIRQVWILAGMAKRIWKARRNAARHSPPIEIAFNPMGVLLSDLSPGRPERRIAHFHETFMCPDTFVERRLRRSIRDYELVVVPDAERVRHTTEVLDLNTPPLVIENYPAKAENPPVPTAKRDGFEVVYCGTFGPDQRLDLLIDSAALWPEATRLVLIGNTNNRFGPHYVKKVQTMGLENRVTFLGWLEIGLAEARMAQADLAVSLLDSSSLQWRTALGASNKRYQYMKAALPQIGDTNPGIPELLEGNGIGACIREATPEALASLVAAYAADPERCHREGQRAFALHREQFNYSVVFRRLLDALGLCKSGGRDV